MSKKIVITRAEIEKDIINALKQPQEMSKEAYKKLTIPSIIIACLLIIIEFVYPIFILWLLLAILISLPVIGIISHFRLKHKIKRVSSDDYDITIETVHSIAEEHYRAERGGKFRRTELVNNYTIRFENGKNWRVPKENYPWSEKLRMSDVGIYKSTHREDVFIVVTKKDTSEIVMAYHTDFFEYKK